MPALIHGGPFANIAHGCNSVIATRMAMAHADWTVTEAGFGFALGAEKFFDIKCVTAGLKCAAVVLVATVRALKRHGGRAKNDLETPDVEAVTRGLGNLRKHLESIRLFHQPAVVAINRFAQIPKQKSKSSAAPARNSAWPARWPIYSNPVAPGAGLLPKPL